MNLPHRQKQGPLRTFLMEPFDIGMHSTEAGVVALQTRFTHWLRGLEGPARFVCWLMPATLDDKIGALSRTAQMEAATNPFRTGLLMEYRRYFEELQRGANYQRAI